MEILVIGHSLVVNSNRSVWSELAKRDGHDVDLICPKNWKSNLISHYEYRFDEKIDSPFGDVFALKAYKQGNGSFYTFSPLHLWRILSRKKYDKIILTQETWSLSLLELTLLKKFTQNRKTLIDLWVCQNLKKEKLSWMHPFERINCQDVDHVLCCCTEINEVIEWKKIEKQCLYFPFSFNASDYKNIPSIQDAKSEFLHLGYLGRLSDEKGMNLILNAYQKSKESPEFAGLKIKLWIAGSGPWAEKWEKLSKEDENINFLGVIKHDQAYKFYEHLHALLLPSQTTYFWKEQFGRVIIEAAAAGRSVIGSNSGAIPEVMGLLNIPYNFKEDSFEDFMRTIQQLDKDRKTDSWSQQLNQSKELSFQLFDHASVAARTAEYLKGEYNKQSILEHGKFKQ